MRIEKTVSDSFIAESIRFFVDNPSDEGFDLIVEFLQKRKSVFDVTETYDNGGGKRYVKMDEKLREKMFAYIKEINKKTAIRIMERENNTGEQ
jgi:hypothetical protein